MTFLDFSLVLDDRLCHKPMDRQGVAEELLLGSRVVAPRHRHHTPYESNFKRNFSGHSMSFERSHCVGNQVLAADIYPIEVLGIKSTSAVHSPEVAMYKLLKAKHVQLLIHSTDGITTTLARVGYTSLSYFVSAAARLSSIALAIFSSSSPIFPPTPSESDEEIEITAHDVYDLVYTL